MPLGDGRHIGLGLVAALLLTTANLGQGHDGTIADAGRSRLVRRASLAPAAAVLDGGDTKSPTTFVRGAGAVLRLPAKLLGAAAPVSEKLTMRAEHTAPAPARSSAVNNRTYFPNIESFMKALESEIKQAWYLQGDPMLVIIGKEAYLISPDKKKPVTSPSDVVREFGNIVGENPTKIAAEAQSRHGITFVAWLTDFDTFLSIAADIDWDGMAKLRQNGKLRGFINGQEYNEDSILKLGHSELLKLAWATIWLRGGMGRAGVLKLTMESARKQASGGLVEQGPAGVSAASQTDWLQAAMEASSSDDFPSPSMGITWVPGITSGV
eukprot:TRINITY_DN38685_c0_g1_i1.p1 TRINITY_DN38685_c0_g1~~TRINITY_DN38685_c0_g1_i1.p1  ORF type:complete len:337 (+),score=63.90 TRINITY_DN38685_c0_g1_i1:42-1013(+)